MNIQRQYSLPNCTLILEGLTDAIGGQPDVRPLMSILVNAECRFAGALPPISGGRDFFDSLVAAVTRYAQEFLSGVPNFQNADNELPIVQFQKIDRNLHRLIVQRRGDVQVGSNNGLTASTAASTPIEFDLTTVQLFDLVEAVDQFFADSQTLPALSLQLTPIEKRFARADEPIAKKAAPVALGVSTLAAAAVAFFLMPVPEVRKPEEPVPQTNSNSLPADPGASGQAGTTESPTSQLAVSSTTTSASPDSAQLDNLSQKLREELDRNWENRSQLDRDLNYRVTVDENGTIVGYTPDDATAADAVNLTPLPKLLPSPAANLDSPKQPVTDFKVVFTSRGVPEVNPWQEQTDNSALSGEITDSALLRDLNLTLHKQIQENKAPGLRFPRTLIFRVAVRPDGTVADFEPRNQAASDYVDQTPLPQLKSANTTASSPADTQPALAYFKLVFTPKGVPQVSPWRGFR